MFAWRLPVAGVLVFLATAACPAEAQRWRVVYTGDTPGSFPRRLTEDPLGRTVLWATGPKSLSASFPAGGTRPDVVRLTPVGDVTEAIAVSPAGALLRIVRSGQRAFSTVLDVPGAAPVWFTRRLAAPEEMVAPPRPVLGSTGTAALAWSTSTGVYVTTRSPGGMFGAPERLVEDHPVVAVVPAIRADGTVEIAYIRQRPLPEDLAYELVHAVRSPLGSFECSRVVAALRTLPEDVLELLAAGSGPTRIVYDDLDFMYSVRTVPGGWSAPQRLTGFDPLVRAARIARLPDGGAIVVWHGGSRSAISVRRAPRDRRFGPRTVLARDRDRLRWELSGVALAVNPRGAAAVGWVELFGADRQFASFASHTDACPGRCDARALVAVASPDDGFAAPVPVSPLGSSIRFGFVAVGIDTTGRPAAAWQESRDSALAPRRLMTAFGPRIGRPAAPRADERPPRATARATLAAVAAAAHGRPLPVRVNCDERCVARVALQAVAPTNDAVWPVDLTFVRAVLERGERRTVRLTVPPSQRARLRRRIAEGEVRLRVIVTDRAGNATGRSFALVG
jgi:hypothetical protein